MYANPLWPGDAIRVWVNIGSCNGFLLNGTKPLLEPTNVELSANVFCVIHLRAISKEVVMNLIHNMRLEITYKILTYHPGAMIY